MIIGAFFCKAAKFVLLFIRSFRPCGVMALSVNFEACGNHRREFSVSFNKIGLFGSVAQDRTRTARSTPIG